MKRKRSRKEGRRVEGSALSDEKKSFEAPQKNDSPLTLAQSGDGKRRRRALRDDANGWLQQNRLIIPTSRRSARGHQSLPRPREHKSRLYFIISWSIVERRGGAEGRRSGRFTPSRRLPPPAKSHTDGLPQKDRRPQLRLKPKLGVGRIEGNREFTSFTFYQMETLVCTDENVLILFDAQRIWAPLVSELPAQ